MLQNEKWPRDNGGHRNAQRLLTHMYDEIEGFNEESVTQGVQLKGDVVKKPASGDLSNALAGMQAMPSGMAQACQDGEAQGFVGLMQSQKRGIIEFEKAGSLNVGEVPDAKGSIIHKAILEEDCPIPALLQKFADHPSDPGMLSKRL